MSERRAGSLTSGSRFIWPALALAKPPCSTQFGTGDLAPSDARLGPGRCGCRHPHSHPSRNSAPNWGSEALAPRLPLRTEFQAIGKALGERVWKVRAKDGPSLVELSEVNEDVARAERWT